MQAYSVQYEFKDPKTKKTVSRDTLIDARDRKSAKNKLMRKHNVKRLTITDIRIIGYL